MVALSFANYEHAIFIPSPAGGRGAGVRVVIMFPLTSLLSPEGRGQGHIFSTVMGEMRHMEMEEEILPSCDEHLTNPGFSDGIGRLLLTG